MHNHWSFSSRSAWALIAAPILAVASLAVVAAGPPATAQSTARTVASVKPIPPKHLSMMDCNGWSPKYKSVNPLFRAHCVDPRGKAPGKNTPWVFGARTYHSNGRFMDNGHYVGHDEPTVKFISSSTNSGNAMTYYMKVPHDPKKNATNNGSVTDYAELSSGPWFGLPICDPNSYPQKPCTPDSDANIGANSSKAAGSAFMELQFYPPRFAPFADSVSCSATYWCAAVTIDSLESQYNFANINPFCAEPVNFAFLQTNGKPTGPPSPQQADLATFTPNRHTLRIHSGDVLKVMISDPAAGLTTTVEDITTHQTGTMTASAAKGFMNTDYKTCAGTLFTFHAEYATAAPQNQVPWAALQGGVLMAQEIGHSETCTSLKHRFAQGLPGFTDKQIYTTCLGGTEGKNKAGEGSCKTRTGVCQHPTTEGTTGPIACPSKNDGSGQLCEFADGACVPQGKRTVIFNSKTVTESSPVNFCMDNMFQNGDLDFDGRSYARNSWPNGTNHTPQSFRYAGPFDQAGNAYPQVQFETDVAGSEFLCNVFTGLNCDAPPLAAKFYPFWSITQNVRNQGIGSLFTKPDCIWNFGNQIRYVTKFNFGRDAQYGASDISVFGGTMISSVRANPEVNTQWGCPALTNPSKD